MDLGVPVEVSTSRTAALFHAVDQMAAWSPFCHPQYAKWAPPEDDDEAHALLRRQAALRKRRGWGDPLEAVLYRGSDSVAETLGRAEARDLVTRADADEEAEILDGLEPKLGDHLDDGSEQTRRLEQRLERESPAFQRMTHEWLRVVGVAPPAEPIPITFVPSPGRGIGGGNASSGVVVIEVPAEGSVDGTLTTVAHELVHALAARRKDAMRRTAAQCGHGLDPTQVGEALAYAVAPGLFAYGEGVGELDRLVRRTSPREPYGRFVRLAVAIRPVMKAALAQPQPDSFDVLLANVCTAAKDLERR